MRRLCFAIPLILAASGSARADELPPEAYARLRKAFVEVLVDGRLEGSGWIAETEGVAVTAAHVVHVPGRGVEVHSADLGRLPARVLAIDRGHDVALLRLPARKGTYPAVGLAAKVPGPSARVYLMGTPVFRHALLMAGRIARDEDGYEFMGFSNDYVRIRHVSGSGPPGSSGGPWVDGRGEVIGLNSGLMRDGAAPSGIGFLVPVGPIRALLESKKTPATPTPGCAFEEVWEQKPDVLRRFPDGTEGLVVRVIKKGGPAATAGLVDGALVTALDGRPVRLREDLVRSLRGRAAGDVVCLTLRAPDGTTSQTSVTLADLESDWK